jgi:hypothetical protein
LDNPTPLYVSVPWGIIVSGLTLYWLYLRFLHPNATTLDGSRPGKPSKMPRKNGKAKHA